MEENNNTQNGTVAKNPMPDENDIDRLFPRCPPNQRPNNNRRTKSNGTNNKKTCNKNQTKSKVLQHSRRELEARRKRISNSNDRTANNISLPKRHSDSSDENNDKNSKTKTAINYHASCSTSSIEPTKPTAAIRKSKSYRNSHGASQNVKKSQSNYEISTKTEPLDIISGIEAQNDTASFDDSYDYNPNVAVDENNNIISVPTDKPNGISLQKDYDKIDDENIEKQFEKKPEKEYEELNQNSNVIAIEQQTTQQLLSLDENDGETDIIRNDASTEELCNIQDFSEQNILATTTETLSTLKISDNPIREQSHILSVETERRSPIQGNSFETKLEPVLEIDEDLTPIAKTALIFPRLEEGLSSEAESCHDDVHDDDEGGMEADVDADDDEDDDDDDVDDDEEEEDVDSQGIQVSSRSRIDSYMNKQMKPHSSAARNLQQHQNIGPIADQNDIGHQTKSTITPYANFAGPVKSIDNNIKSITNNYATQNGQMNYWSNSLNNQSNINNSQASSNQLYNNQTRNHASSNNDLNNNLTTKNISFNREEAKVTSRLSSDTDNETDRLLGSQRCDKLKMNNANEINNPEVQGGNSMKQNASSREVLIEGVLFGVKYLGSTHTDCDGRAEKEDRIHQAEMAVHEVKFRNGDSRMATEVQLFISTEKIMVLDDKQRRIMMDHSLRTISYIADIGDAIVLIVRKKNSTNELGEIGRPVSKISCHVFESSESHTITKSISQAFQVAYTELMKANGGGDVGNYLPRELDYQEVLNSQEMSTDHLEMFARKENQREVVVPKKKGEILGISIIESGWGSVLPTVVIANLKQDGPAYNCKKLSIGDQILSVNGVSLVGLPLSECQEILKKTKKQRVAKLSVVPCPVTVEVKIKRPDTKYQLGFSVQNGVICSLLRGGIAERGGVRVGHRIMSINGTTVVGVPHEKIVTLLASSVGEIRMETCLTSLYRLMLGEENPVHF